MSNPQPNDSGQIPEEDLQELLSDMDINQWLETLRHSDRSLYNLMALEVWSLAKTMDSSLPGFWARFMENRRASLQQFIQNKQSEKSKAKPETKPENCAKKEPERE